MQTKSLSRASHGKAPLVPAQAFFGSGLIHDSLLPMALILLATLGMLLLLSHSGTQPGNGRYPYAVPAGTTAVTDQALPQDSPAAGNNTADVPQLPDPQLMMDDITQLGMQAPRHFDPFQTAFLESRDLYGFLMDTLPAARAGHAAAQHHIYLTLEECRAYLGPNGDATLHEAILGQYAGAPTTLAGNSIAAEAEQALWMQEYYRCKNFVGASLTALELAMGNDMPGTVAEYGSVWFEYAYRSGYPLALAQLATASAPISSETSEGQLWEAAIGGDPMVFLILSEHAGESKLPGSRRSAVAWLIVACRAGLDCSQNAHWFQARFCAAPQQSTCLPGESAIAHFWSPLSAEERLAAYQEAAVIESALRTGHLEQIPWPATGTGQP